MKYSITINKIESLEEIKGYWTENDFRALLEEMGVEDSQEMASSELWDYFCMAVEEVEPEEAAEIVLTYKLGEVLNAGQIQNMSHEMLLDKIAEEYPDIALHYSLFNINELLYKAYNGKFPRTLATKLNLTLTIKGEAVPPSKAVLLKSLAALLSDRSPIKRLFEEQLKEEAVFEDAEHIIWELHPTGEDTYTLITSDYWINKEDIKQGSFTQ